MRERVSSRITPVASTLPIQNSRAKDQRTLQNTEQSHLKPAAHYDYDLNHFVLLPPTEGAARGACTSSAGIQRRSLVGAVSPSKSSLISSRAVLHQAALQGIRTPSHPLPYGSLLQAAFGKHSLRQVRAHLGREAAASAESIQAQAYTSGEHIVFAGSPNLHTAAHEAAHVIQQREGMQLLGGLDTVGDRYERHAEAVARRVVAGRSAEALLDRGAEKTRVGQSGTGSAENADGATLQPLQRLRAGVQPTVPLDATEEQAQKDIFTEQKGEEGPPVTVVSGQETILFNAFEVAAQELIDAYNDERAPVTGGTGKQPQKRAKTAPSPVDYDAILALAVQKVRALYGIQLSEAHGEASGRGESASFFSDAAYAGGTAITRADPDTRFTAAKGDPGRVKNEAVDAARYLIDFARDYPVVETAFNNLVAYHQGLESTVTATGVEEAYLEELENAGPNTLEKLAESRLRYDPKTEGNVIYFAASPQKVSEESAWLTYKSLVHEVLHTAAHKKFDAYARDQGALGNSILEGTTDYFSQRVWQAITDQLLALPTDPANKGEIQTVQEISAKGSAKDKLSKDVKDQLRALRDEYLYENDVDVIKKAIATISNGEERLKAAFFYGDVEHFFPKFN